MLITPSAWNEAANRLELSGFVLDLNRGELLTPEDQLAGLRKQALDVLLVLGARAGQVVSKDELMSRVWPDVVVGEGSLVQAIGDIRRVLGDSGHRLIRNVARRGYMLVPEGSSTQQTVAADAITAPPLAREHADRTTPRCRAGGSGRRADSASLACASSYRRCRSPSSARRSCSAAPESALKTHPRL